MSESDEPRPAAVVRAERAMKAAVILWCLLVMYATLDWAPFRLIARLEALERDVRDLKAARRP